MAGPTVQPGVPAVEAQPEEHQLQGHARVEPRLEEDDGEQGHVDQADRPAPDLLAGEEQHRGEAEGDRAGFVGIHRHAVTS